MLDPNEIINVKSWMSLGDSNYEIDHDDDSIPESGVVYCNIEHIHKFFEKCYDTNNKYIVVSAFSDYGVALQEEHPVPADMLKWVPFIEAEISGIGYSPLIIPQRCEVEKCKVTDRYSVKCHSSTYSTFNRIPNNVVKWFCVNSMIEDERIINIPLGVGKDAPIDIAEVCIPPSNPLKHSTADRVNWVYVNWQGHTVERIKLKQALSKYDPHWATIVTEAKPYKEYLSDLCNHAFALCPEGNGIDCYRILECIYSGCIPVLKKKIAYSYLEDLPHVVVGDWGELTFDFLKSELDRIQQFTYNFDKTKLSYWKNLIDQTRKLL